MRARLDAPFPRVPGVPDKCRGDIVFEIPVRCRVIGLPAKEYRRNELANALLLPLIKRLARPRIEGARRGGAGAIDDGIVEPRGICTVRGEERPVPAARVV